jgi:hypothetical protein
VLEGSTPAAPASPAPAPAPALGPAPGGVRRGSPAPGGARSAPTHPYYDANHPDHERAVHAVAQRFRQAYPEPDGSPSPAPLRSDFENLHAHHDALPDDLRDFAAVARELGWTPEQAQAWLDFDAGHGSPPEIAEINTLYEVAEAALRREWGSEYDYRVKLAGWAVKQSGGRAMLDGLAETGAGNSPQVVKWFSRMGARRLAEDVTRGRHRQSKAYRDQSHPQHEQVVQRVNRLFAIAFE